MGNSLTTDKLVETLLENHFEEECLTAKLLRGASHDAIFRLLPLIMSMIEEFARNSNLDQRDDLIKILQVLRVRVAAHRWIKLRFLILAKLPAFKSFWGLDLMYKEHPYGGFGDQDLFEFEEDEEKVAERDLPGSVKHIVIRVPVDIVDLQSEDFWRMRVYNKKVESGYEFPLSSVIHPMYCIGKNGKERSDNGEHSRSIIESVGVKKVFSSVARPKIVTLRSAVDKVKLSQLDEGFKSVSPMLMVKAGDNLMADVGVMMMFRCFNAIWRTDSELSEKYDGVIPFSFAYEITPTSASRGHLEGLDDLTALVDFSWKNWAEENADNPDNTNHMLRTAVGSYIATYVLGVRDRHFDNILIQDNKKMLHIDFSYLLGGRPPVDGPPISLSPGMEQGMKAAGIWDNFIDMSVDAFKSLRNNCDDIIRLASIMFPKAGLDSRSVQNYLKGSMSLNLAAEEDDALLSVRTQIVNSTEDFGNWFKEYTHENVLPVWYNLLKEGFPPAQSAMEAYSGWKQERENWLAETKVKIEDEDALEIS